MLVAKRFSLRPDKLVLYNEVTPTYKTINNINELEIIPNVKINANIIEKFKPTVKKQFHQFKISDNAYRNLKEKINWLYYLSKTRYKQTYTKKHIYTFRLSFLTLTLPSIQKHSTSFITKNIFNQFLIEIRTRCKMNNYVWRLEFQKNGNVHYHLISDSYIDYFMCLTVWNRIINKYGYVDDYQKKFKGKSLYEYNQMTNKYNKTDFQIIKNRYTKGVKMNWLNPNSVDVKSVTNKKAIANYISKYFSKNPIGNSICNKLDNEINSKSLRLWFCSRTLSKLKSITDYVENYKYDIEYFLSKCSEIKYVYHQYVTIIYFKIKDYKNRFSKLIDLVLRNYAKEIGYKSAF